MVQIETPAETKARLLKSMLDLPRLAKIYSVYEERLASYCQRVPRHATRKNCFCPKRKEKLVPASTDYDNTVTIYYDHNDPRAELLLAHELMHYIIVLEGGLLPVPRDPMRGSKVEYVRLCIMRGLTHHRLLIHRLEESGYSADIRKYSLKASGLFFERDTYNAQEDCRFKLLNCMDNRLFIRKSAVDKVFLPLVESEGLIRLYDKLCAIPPSERQCQVKRVNELSTEVIHTYDMDEEIEMVDLDEYIIRRQKFD